MPAMENGIVQTGLEALLKHPLPVLESARLGLVMNQASVDARLRLSCHLIDQFFPKQLRCLFSPQHGIWGEQQANMIETQHSVYQPLKIPVFSLYSETRRPTDEMLDLVDCIIIDLQDVGTRVYTFVWTMLEVLRACSAKGKSVVVLDRPNPLGGVVVEGPVLDTNFISFVGGACIPMRHACTMAELAQLMNEEYGLNVDLHTSPMHGWKRRMMMQDTGLPWIWPSPNMPTLKTTIVYPGQVLLEGVNLSEGRGTTRPFEIVGAPFVDADRWIQMLERFPLPGVKFLPTRFRPTFDKWANTSCQGVDLQIVEPQQFRSFAMTTAIIATAAKLFSDFQYLNPPYEYETQKVPIDILFGSNQLRHQISMFQAGQQDENGLITELSGDFGSWHARVKPHLLYAD